MDVEQVRDAGAKVKHFRGDDDLNQAADLNLRQLLQRNVEAALMQTHGVDRVALVEDSNDQTGFKVYCENGDVILVAMKNA